MATNSDIVRVAREYIGTPWIHQGRLKNVGVDCVGLLICTVRELLGECADIPGYDRMPDGTLLANLDDHLDRIEIADAIPGNVIAMKFGGQPHHVAILGDYVHGGFSIIHSFARSGKVVETRLSPDFAKLIVATYRVRGIE